MTIFFIPTIKVSIKKIIFKHNNIERHKTSNLEKSLTEKNFMNQKNLFTFFYEVLVANVLKSKNS